VRRLIPLALLVLAIAVAAIATAAPSEPEAVGTAVAARVTQPGLQDEVALSVYAPPAADDSISGWSYPEDGSVARIGSGSVSAAAQPGVSSSAQGIVELLAVTLFGGEITVESVSSRATAAAGAANASSDASASTVTGLTVLGQLITPSANTQVPLADWGLLDILASTVESTLEPPRAARATVTGLRVKLLADHGGLPAGSVIEIGTATAAAAAAGAEEPVPVVPAAPKPVKPVVARPVVPASAPQEPGGKVIPGAPAELVRPAPVVSARLTAGGYVFPVYGPASFGDTFGDPRSDVEGGWHHGADIFAPLGTPLLAVADGTIFSVGWNDIGGWRLWLRDREGNEFYYAHLSAYSPLAVNGRQVKAGDVIGFMGKTGDARYSAVHLHFEIHPVGMLSLGYHGVVAPYAFLVSWRRAQDVSFTAGRIYLPIDGSGGGVGVAPPVGAVLLEADDISSASGLVPGALEQALSGRAPKGTRPAQDR
jgi:murein DD-endopeptidase MepM/ murein hydrolase activator NlpD